MSRTDKDRPYEVKLADLTERRVEHHNHIGRQVFCVTEITEVERTRYSWRDLTPYTFIERTRHGYYHVYEPECDIEIAGYGYRQAGAWWRRGCYHSLADERYHSAVPKDFRDHHWNNPERVRERDHLGEVRKAYNAGEDISDYDFPNFQHRHGAAWDWC